MGNLAQALAFLLEKYLKILYPMKMKRLYYAECEDLQLRTKYLAYFPLLTIIMNTTSRFKLLYTAPNQATLALALVIGLGPLALWI